jgi:hypothetical protein
MSFSQMLTDVARRRYQDEIVKLESLDEEAAQAEARKLIKSLAYDAFQRTYLTEMRLEGFDHLWRLAFPNEAKGGKQLK